MDIPYTIELKDVADLTEAEKEACMHVSIEMYPEFTDLYKEHRYYSAVEPQKVWLVKDGEELIGTGKFLWRDITLGEQNRRLCAFGMVVLPDYQKKGVGGHLIDRTIREASAVAADLIFASTDNPLLKNMLESRGFRELATPIIYNAPGETEKRSFDTPAYVFELTEGVHFEIEALEAFDIGDGPL